MMSFGWDFRWGASRFCRQASECADAIERLMWPCKNPAGKAGKPYSPNMPVFRACQKRIGHGGTYHDSNGGTLWKVMLAWLNRPLKGNKEAAKIFQGDKCSLCADAQWVTRKKKID